MVFINAFEATHGRFGFVTMRESHQDSAYYLESVSGLGIRRYAAHQKTRLLNVDECISTIIQVEFVQDTVDPAMLREILPVLRPNMIHVFSVRAAFNNDVSELKEDSHAANILLRAIKSGNSPVFFLSRGRTTNSRMFFLALSDYNSASVNSTFGFPKALTGDPGIAAQLLAD